jgi:hypothetical protein
VITAPRRTENLNVRFRTHELDDVIRASEISRLTVSEFTRAVLLDAARRRLARADGSRDERREAA